MDILLDEKKNAKITFRKNPDSEKYRIEYSSTTQKAMSLGTPELDFMSNKKAKDEIIKTVEKLYDRSDDEIEFTNECRDIWLKRSKKHRLDELVITDEEHKKCFELIENMRR